MHGRILAVGLALLLACAIGSDVCAQQVQGSTNWRQGTIEAVGIGVPPANARSKAQGRAMARRAAVVDAQRNLLEIIKGVNVDSETKVENAMVTDDIIFNRVKGILRGAVPIGQPNYYEDGSVEVTLMVSARGDLADVLLPKQGFAAPAPPPPADAPPPPADAYTGLIVDARGLSLQPAMAPKVVDENDTVVYGAALVSRDAAVREGIGAYDKDLEAAKKNDRVGKKPLVVKGIKAIGRNKTNVVLSAADGKKVQEAAKGATFLSECRVILILD